MQTTSNSNDQGIPFDGNPSPFPPFRNISSPYLITLSLPGHTIGFPVFLFSTSDQELKTSVVKWAKMKVLRTTLNPNDWIEFVFPISVS